MTTLVKKIKDSNGIKNFLVKTHYLVTCNEGNWMCECALEHKRNINTNCKHIKLCKKNG